MLHFRASIDIVLNAGRKQCRNHLHSLKQHLSEALAKVRQTLAVKVRKEKPSQEGDSGLAELQALLIMPIIEKVKGVLQDLLVCLLFDVSFKKFTLLCHVLINFVYHLNRYFYSQIYHLV